MLVLMEQPLKKKVMKTLGQPDFSAQETMHHLLSLKLVSSSFKVNIISLNGFCKIRRNITNENELITSKSLLDYYACRDQLRNESDKEEILTMNFDKFASKFKIAGNKLVKQDQSVIPKFYPKYSSNPEGGNYPMYCKYQLIRYKPWLSTIQDAWNNIPEQDTTYVQQWISFLKTEYAKSNLKDWNEEIEVIEHQLLQEYTQGDLYSTDEVHGTHEQEDWMQISNLVHNEYRNLKQNSLEWSQGYSNYTQQQIGEMHNWIPQHRQNDQALQ